MKTYNVWRNITSSSTQVNPQFWVYVNEHLLSCVVLELFGTIVWSILDPKSLDCYPIPDFSSQTDEDFFQSTLIFELPIEVDMYLLRTLQYEIKNNLDFLQKVGSYNIRIQDDEDVPRDC